MGKTVGGVVETSKDQTGMGQWSTILLTGTDRKRLRIIMAYRVCQDKIKKEGKKTLPTNNSIAL
eukprot:5849897-Ditylum_brightwellii.AAC.2